MLPDWMIDALKREEQRRQEEQRPQVEISIPLPQTEKKHEEEPRRGVVTIQVV